jgi:hypothetical protein
MAQTATQEYSTGVVHKASGSFSGTHTAADYTLTLGFVPKYFKVVNVTDRVTQEWWYGFTAAQFMETAADGTRTLETDSAITVNSDGTVDLDVSTGNYTDDDLVVWEAWA